MGKDKKMKKGCGERKLTQIPINVCVIYVSGWNGVMNEQCDNQPGQSHGFSTSETLISSHFIENDDMT